MPSNTFRVDYRELRDGANLAVPYPPEETLYGVPLSDIDVATIEHHAEDEVYTIYVAGARRLITHEQVQTLLRNRNAFAYPEAPLLTRRSYDDVFPNDLVEQEEEAVDHVTTQPTESRPMISTSRADAISEATSILLANNDVPLGTQQSTALLKLASIKARGTVIELPPQPSHRNSLLRKAMAAELVTELQSFIAGRFTDMDNVAVSTWVTDGDPDSFDYDDAGAGFGVLDTDELNEAMNNWLINAEGAGPMVQRANLLAVLKARSGAGYIVLMFEVWTTTGRCLFPVTLLPHEEDGEWGFNEAGLTVPLVDMPRRELIDGMQELGWCYHISRNPGLDVAKLLTSSRYRTEVTQNVRRASLSPENLPSRMNRTTSAAVAADGIDLSYTSYRPLPPRMTRQSVQEFYANLSTTNTITGSSTNA